MRPLLLKKKKKRIISDTAFNCHQVALDQKDLRRMSCQYVTSYHCFLLKET